MSKIEVLCKTCEEIRKCEIFQDFCWENYGNLITMKETLF